MAELKYDKKTGRLLFTKQMKKEYTILMPNMAPIHFKILEKVFNYYGYKSDLLDTTGPEIAQTGLKYVHNDTCYPALLVIGQFINALQSGCSQGCPDDYSDRRRMSCVQLHFPFEKGSQKGRL